MYLENLAEKVATKVFARFPKIIPDMMEIISGVLQSEKEYCRDLVEQVIDS